MLSQKYQKERAMIEHLPFQMQLFLKKFTETIPVDLNSMAQELSIEVFEELFSDEQEGYIVKGNRFANFTIYLNTNKPDVRRRFTLAHEISHAILHSDVINQTGSMDRGIRTGYEDYREAEANNLAADIIMPYNKIRQIVDDEKINNTSDLAERFQVSEFAMKIRLGLA